MWDAAEYYDMAEALSRGQSHASFAYRPLLYPLFLGLINLIFGVGMFWIRVIQIIIGSFVCVLVMKFGERLFGRSAGIIAGVMASMSGLMFFYDLEFSPTGLVLLLNLLFLWELNESINGEGSPLHAGLYFGLGLLTWPIAFPFLPIAVWWLYRYQSATPYIPSIKVKIIPFRWQKRLKRMRMPVNFLLGAIPPILLSLILHTAAGWGSVLLSGHGGVNFYIGNNRNADGVTANLPGVGVGWNWEIAHDIAQNATGERLNVAQVDRYYWNEGIREIFEDPVHWLNLMKRKLLLFWNKVEISNNQDFYYHANRFSIFRWLMWLGLPIVLVPAFIGLTVGWQQRGVRLLGAFLIIYYIGVVLFFVNARFRHPITPLLFILAGGGVMDLIQSIRYRSRLTYKRWIIIGTAGTIGLLLPFAVNSGVSTTSFDYGLFTEGNALETLGRLREAENHYRQAVEVNPSAPYINFKLAELVRQRGDNAQAVDIYKRELIIQPNYSRAWNNLGIALLELGDEEQALNSFIHASKGNPFLPEAARNAARIWGRRGLVSAEEGDWKIAAQHFDEAIKLIPSDPMYQTMQLRCEIQLGTTLGIHERLVRLLDQFPNFPPAQELICEWDKR